MNIVVALVLALLLAAPGAARAADDGRPLPDAAELARHVKDRLKQVAGQRAHYVYLERKHEIDVGKLGGVSDGAVKVYEVHPSEDPGNTWKRLLSVDGVPLTDEELATNDAKHRRDLAERDREPPAKREREASQAKRDEQAAIDDVFRVYRFDIVGRQQMNGYPTIVVTIEPRPDVEPHTDEGKLMKKFRGRAWIHETEYEVVKVDLEAIDDLKYGWGIVGRVHEGAKVSFERREVDGGVWLPSRQRLKATGRTLLFRKFSIDSLTEWFGYRRRGELAESSRQQAVGSRQ